MKPYSIDGFLFPQLPFCKIQKYLIHEMDYLENRKFPINAKIFDTWWYVFNES